MNIHVTRTMLLPMDWTSPDGIDWVPTGTKTKAVVAGQSFPCNDDNLAKSIQKYIDEVFIPDVKKEPDICDIIEQESA